MSEPRRVPSVPSFTTVDNDVTYLIVCGGGRAVYTPERIQAELDLGRQVWVFPTPTAAAWLDPDEILALTGRPPHPEMPDPLTPPFDPQGHRVLVSPCTLNSLTKWAAGHADNLALSLLCEAIGTPGIEVRAEVSLSGPYAVHPAVADALAVLRRCGVELTAIEGSDPLPDLD